MNRVDRPMEQKTERGLFECRTCGIHEWRKFPSLADRIKAEREFGVAHISHDWRAEADYVIEQKSRSDRVR